MFSSNEARQTLGRVIDSAQHEPILIEKHSRPAAVILSVTEYQKRCGRSASATGRQNSPPAPGKTLARTLPIVRGRRSARRRALDIEEMLALVAASEAMQEAPHADP
ncbi:MAG: type II toxin-antitoxin system Phd/YefM family antitoxin [Opitutales bacterium]